MKEEIPESFWEALVEVKDKDIKDARELYQTAMELAKKYKDERDEARQWKKEMLCVESQWDEQAVGRLLGIQLGESIKANIEAKLRQLIRERDEYRIGHDRYEKLRRLNLQQIKELYLKNLRTGEHFDTLVDKLI